MYFRFGFFRFAHPYLSLLYFSGVLQFHDFILVLSFGKPSLVLQIISNRADGFRKRATIK